MTSPWLRRTGIGWPRNSRALVATNRRRTSLQKSVTEFLTIVSQIARGDLTLRGKVTNDALGNVVDSVNYMLDNFTKVLERVRNAAIDVASERERDSDFVGRDGRPAPRSRTRKSRTRRPPWKS